MTGSPTTPGRDALAYAASRLVRHSAEFGPAPALTDAGPDARLVLMMNRAAARSSRAARACGG
jgi:NAD+ diphosphatase